MKVMALVRMVMISFSGGQGLRSVLMNGRILFFKIVYDPFSYEMRGDVFGDDREFGGIPDGMNDAMSNGGGDGSSEDNVKTKDISILVSEFVF